MSYQVFKDTEGLITYLPEVINSTEKANELLIKYRNNEIEAGNEVSIIENNSFISIDSITRVKTYYQMIEKQL